MSGDNNKTIGRYEIEREIGRGGMAVVYQARDPRLDRTVALKLIRKGAFPPEQLTPMTERFRREAKALAKLNHANIVKVMDYGEHEGAPYLVMEYIEGATLKEVKKPLRVDTAVRLIRPIAEALEYVHGQGLLHRDVKPSNIMLTKDQRVILTDFGIAKWIEDEETQATLTGTGVGIGTPEYMAPEQGRGQRVDGRTDAYSLTVVFYELITGEKPYQGKTPIDILVKQASEPIPDPREFVPELNESVKRFLDRAMAKRPEDRYPTMKDYLRDLEGLRLQSLAQVSVGNNSTAEIRTRPEGGAGTGSSVRFGKTDFQRVREAANGAERIGEVSDETAGSGKRKRKIEIYAAAAVMLAIVAAFMLIRGDRGKPSLPMIPTTLFSGRTENIIAATPQTRIRATADMRGTEEANAMETAAVSRMITTTEEASKIQRTQAAAVWETSEYLERQATELAAVSAMMTETARRDTSILETQIVSLGKTATFAVALTEEASKVRRQATAEAENLFDAATQTAANISPYANVKAGDMIEFGRYEQDNNLSNGTEPIGWQVLEVSDGSALAISRYGLDKKGYHSKYTDVSWENCDLRKWLLEEFYESAFNANEKQYIETTRLINADNPESGTPGGNDTYDKVFILSLDEAVRYFSGNSNRIGKPTYYAEARGAWTSKESGYIGNAWWWLRSGGLDARQAARVFPGGAPDYDGAFVNDDRGVVRPALRIRLDPANK